VSGLFSPLPAPFPLRDLPLHAPLRSTRFMAHSAHMLCYRRHCC